MTSLFIGPPPATPYAQDTGMFQGPPPASSGASGAEGMDAAGGFLSIAGAATQVIGSYFAVQASRDQAKLQADQLEFEGWLSRLNARTAEDQAQAALEAGKRDIALRTLQAGQEIAATEASFGARGVVAGVGSSAEQVASQRLVKELDVLNLGINAVRQANAARAAGVNASNEGAFQQLSAANLRRSAKSMNPWLGATSSLLGSATQVADHYYTARRLREMRDLLDRRA